MEAERAMVKNGEYVRMRMDIYMDNKRWMDIVAHYFSMLYNGTRKTWQTKGKHWSWYLFVIIHPFWYAHLLSRRMGQRLTPWMCFFFLTGLNMIQHHVFYGLWFMGTAHLPEWTVLEQCWTAMINIISTSGPFPESEVDMFDMSATDVPGEKPSSELHAESTLEPFWSWDNDQRRSMRWDDGMIPTNASWDSWSFCLHLEVSIVMGVPKNSCFIMEIPIQKDDDWGYPYFRKTPFGSFGFDWNLGAPLGIFPPCKESTGVGMGVAGIIMNDFYGSFPHSLHLAPVRLSIHEISIESPEVFYFFCICAWDFSRRKDSDGFQ